MATTPKKFALLAGCNYEGTNHELRGCINDVTTFKQVLKERFDFDESNITLFVDSVGTPLELQPTGVNIKNKLKELIARADKRDLIVFYYSGHGTQFLDDKENDLDEAIVPTDLNLITDIDFGDILSELRGGTSFFFISDSCHSGGLLDKTRKPSEFSKAFVNTPAAGSPKLITYPALKRILNARARGGDSETVSQQMKELFADNASLKFTSNKEQLTAMKDSFSYRGILFSACKAEEVSFDVTIDGKHCGAFSASLQNVLRADVKPLKVKFVSDSVKEGIEASPYRAQHPQLYCDDKELEKIFLLQEHDAPEPKDFGLPDISGAVDASGDGSKELDDNNKNYALQQIKDVVDAYYRVSSKDFKDNFEDLYGKVAAAKGTNGAVSAKDWAELVSSAKNTDKEVVSDFSLEIVGTGDDLLDRTDAMMIYYASRTKLQFRCQSESCEGNRVLNHLYFTCLSCFKMHEETYDVCSTCLTEKTRCPNGHKNFIDTHSLLQEYHMKELNMQNSSGEKDVKDVELKKALDDAEKAFEDGPMFNDPKSKALGVNFGLQTDEGCSIM